MSLRSPRTTRASGCWRWAGACFSWSQQSGLADLCSTSGAACAPSARATSSAAKRLRASSRYKRATAANHGAVTVACLRPNSALLTVHGWGHTSLFLSACADETIARYLVDLTTPAPGTVCEQDVVPFSQ